MRLRHWRWLMVAAVTVVPIAAAAALAGDKGGKGSKRSPPDETKPIYQPLPANAASEAGLLRRAGSNFKLRQTPHFVIAYDTDDATLKNFISRVEVTYRSVAGFAERMEVATTVPAEKLQIVFFDQLADYQAFGRKIGFPADEGAPGFYQHDLNQSAFFNYANSKSVAQAREELQGVRDQMQRAAPGRSGFDPNRVKAFEANIDAMQDRINRLVVQHEVAHHVLFNIGLHAKGAANPRWFSEGLATMFETPPSRSGAGIGAINQDRLGDWLELERTGKLTALREFVGNAELLLPSNPDAVNGYAQAWSLVHYLQRSKRPQLVAYIQLIRQRMEERIYSPEEELATFEKAFGPLDQRFSENWVSFIKRLPYRPGETRG